MKVCWVYLPNENSKGSVTVSLTPERSLFQRNFLAYWIGTTISLSGDSIFYIALTWTIFQVSKSQLELGILLAVFWLPALGFGLFAGAYADTANRKHIMIYTNMFQGLVDILIVVSYLVQSQLIITLFFLVFFRQLGQELFRPASKAVIPEIVGRDNLGSANSLLGSSSQAVQFLGFGVGGILLGEFGVVPAFLYDALTFFTAAGLYLAIRGVKKSVPLRSGVREGVREGLAYVNRNPMILEFIAVTSVLSFLVYAVNVVAPSYVSSSLKGSSLQYGFFIASFSIGSVIGALAIGRLNFRKYVGRVVVSGVIVTGCLEFLLGISHSVLFSYAIAGMMGVALGAASVPAASVIQAIVPKEFMGRVTSLIVVSQVVATVLSAVITGSIAQRFGPESMLLVYGVMIATLGISAAFLKSLRRARY